MLQVTKIAAHLLIAVLITASCKKEIANQPPTAYAGNDKFIDIVNTSFELNGAGTDLDGKIVTYSWSKVAGPVRSTILNPGSAVTKVEKLDIGVYEFELKVVDNGGLSATDKVVVTVDSSANDPSRWDY